ATGDGATALGDSAKASVDRSLALGRGAQASALNATAIGAGANASAQNSVALGSGSTTTATLSAAAYNPGAATLAGTSAAGEVSVGAAGYERRVTNVAAGSAATDAVNVSQLQSQAAVVTSLSTLTSTGLSSLSTGLSTTGSTLVSLSTSASTGLSSLSTGLSTTGSTLVSLSTSASTGLSSLSTGLSTTGSTLVSLSTSASTGLSSLSTGLSTTGSTLVSLSTSASTGLSSLSTGLANSVQYDNPDHTSVTLGGANASAPVSLHNVADGVANNDAANVGQLNAATTQLGNQIANVSNNVAAATRYFKANGNNDGTDDAVAQGANAVAVGRAAVAGPASAMALGAGAQALGQSSIAMGAGATATSDVNGGIGGIAIGAFASAGNNPAAGKSVGPSVAIGGSSQADHYSVALGAGARALVDNSVALGTLANATAANAVALGHGSIADRANTVSVGAAGAERQIVNVAAGTADTDAVNVSQLKNAGVLDSNGQVANVVTYDDASKGAITLGGANGTKIRNVAAGDLSATSMDAVNGSQLNATNEDLANMQKQINNGSIGLVQQDAVSHDITVGKDTDGTLVNMAGTAGNRTVTGVANGAVDESSVDAINGSQLHGTASSAAAALGGGSTVNPDGTISAPNYKLGGTTVHNVGDAITNIDGRVTQNTTDITNVQNQINNGSIGLVQQDAASRDITVGKDTDGTLVNVAGTAGNRTVTGVANGAVNESSVDAINGSQLYGTASSAASALGGGATVNADGTIGAPSYNVGGTTVHNVGDAITNIDGRVTQNANDIQNFQNQINDGTIGLVRQDSVGNITVGASTGGMLVNMAGTAGNRVVTGVANGAVNASSVDAVNGSQLYALQNQVTDLNSQMSNLAPNNPYFNANEVPASSDAVVHAANPGSGEGSTAAGAGAVASGKSATVIGANANAAADNSVAVGAGAAATGTNSTAIGSQAQASNNNSVALGQGSTTDRDNSVSVGSGSQQRQITSVAAGTADTDAVNVGQLNSSVAQGVQQANSYTDQAFNAMNREIDSVAKKSYAGTAAAVATANLPQAPAPGKSIVAVAGGTYAGQSAVALGLSTFTPNGKWIIKASASTTTGRTVAAGASAGYVW
ncbi:hypothetical protein BTH42_33080, partial [Burkholderia sp. SRS-W-2-2016]|uniref:YadA family autotransporter adhesin n=1 Tax=Burkholderia sp. SRS-W-2-2016 TaxID=1926878 RepID=UPI00094B476F